MGVRAFHPATVFVVLAALFGVAVVIANPPMRGPDEMAHFIRAYAVSRGEFVPTMVDAEGRKGTYLPARLNEDMEFFETRRYRVGGKDFHGYHEVVEEYLRLRAARGADEPARPPVFILYTGSEGYSPAAYLPYAAAALVGRIANLDFITMLYLMRFAGLAAMIAVVAYAIAVVPHLRWAFLLIAMLPASLYSRAVISVDGGALAYTMVVAALCLRGACTAEAGRVWERSLWLLLSTLTKPPQLAFILLEAMIRPFRELPRRWRTLALVLLPALILSPLWIVAVSGDVGVWRMLEGSGNPQQFDPIWKLRFMLENPLHFPKDVLGSLKGAPELWWQLIGVLGWLDTRLLNWLYPILTVFLFTTWLERIELDRPARALVAVVAALTVLGYCFAVFLIFFLSWTPIDAHEVAGVQGRYFIVALPALAIAVAAIVGRGPPASLMAAIAILGAILAGGATIEALLRFNWWPG